MQDVVQPLPAPQPDKPKARYSAWFKLLAVLVALAGVLITAYALLQTRQIYLAFQPHEYQNSQQYISTLTEVMDNVCYYALNYRTDGDSSGTYAQQEADARAYTQKRIQVLQAQYQADIGQMAVDAQNNEGESPLLTLAPTATPAATAVPGIAADSQPLSTAPFTSDMLQRKEQLDRDIASENQNLQQTLDSLQMVRQDNDNRAASIAVQLKALDGILYAAVSADGKITTNLGATGGYDDFFKTCDHKLVATMGQVLQGAPVNYQYGWQVSAVASSIPAGAKIYVAMTPEKYARLEADYNAQKAVATNTLAFVVAGILSTLAGLAWLLYTAGRRPIGAGIVLTASDWPFLDVQLAVLIGIVTLCGAGVFGIVNSLVPTEYLLSQPVLLACYGALIAVALLFTLLFLTSATKRAKRGELLRHTLVFVVLRGIWRFLRNLAMGLKAATRLVLIFMGYAVGLGLLASLFGWNLPYGNTAEFFIFLLELALTSVMLAYILHKAVSFKNLAAAVRRIQAGELGVRVPTGGGSEFAQLAGSINNIADGLKAAVDSEVKAERMRAELVTNVSHDLKTPLTSIVTYVDLLKTEGLHSENAPHYLDVIDQKTARLKTLTSDLFEAAKAASGSLPVNLERVDVCALLAQGLSELSDRILASGLDMKLQLPADRLLLRADGRLLWRVMENLLSNVFKYALQGSRVYLSAARAGNRGVLTLKNISAYELNIAPEELTERFTRGDASRHSEGSGLGLSIARSLTELQAGEFKIEIDGDLFKVIVSLPVWEE